MAGYLTPLPSCKANMASFIHIVRFDSMVWGVFLKGVFWSVWFFCFFVCFCFILVPNLICEGSDEVTWWNLLHQLMRFCTLFIVKNIFWKCIYLHVWSVCIWFGFESVTLPGLHKSVFNGCPHHIFLQCNSLFPLQGTFGCVMASQVVRFERFTQVVLGQIYIGS